VLFIASLFVVSESLDATGVTAWAGQQLVARAGESRARLLVLSTASDRLPAPGLGFPAMLWLQRNRYL
jgi:hypothetical protein